MNVYVIGTGERGEGSTPVAATLKLQAARQYVRDRWLVDLCSVGTGQWMAELGNPVDLVHVHRIHLADRTPVALPSEARR